MKTLLSREQQVSRTLALWRDSIGVPVRWLGPNRRWEQLPLIYGDYSLVVVKIPRRLFLAGDVLWLYYSNGAGERGKLYGLSGKGFLVNGFYAQYAHWDKRECKKKWIEVIEVPDHLTKIPPDSPALLDYLLSRGGFVRPLPQVQCPTRRVPHGR